MKLHYLSKLTDFLEKKFKMDNSIDIQKTTKEILDASEIVYKLIVSIIDEITINEPIIYIC